MMISAQPSSTCNMQNEKKTERSQRGLAQEIAEEKGDRVRREKEQRKIMTCQALEDNGVHSELAEYMYECMFVQHPFAAFRKWRVRIVDIDIELLFLSQPKYYILNYSDFTWAPFFGNSFFLRKKKLGEICAMNAQSTAHFFGCNFSFLNSR